MLEDDDEELELLDELVKTPEMKLLVHSGLCKYPVLIVQYGCQVSVISKCCKEFIVRTQESLFRCLTCGFSWPAPKELNSWWVDTTKPNQVRKLVADWMGIEEKNVEVRVDG